MACTRFWAFGMSFDTHGLFICSKGLKIMYRIKCALAYDGTGFSGYQVQPNGRTVQGECERVLMRMHKGQMVRISASGRTDAGVHAVGQVIHFDTNLDIPMIGWVKGLNAQLPNDIRVIKAEEVTLDFHSRFNAKRKEYRYNFAISRNETNTCD